MGLTVLLEVKDNIATITLNRPEAMNTFNDVMTGDLQAALDKAGDDSSVRAIILTGKGKAFSAGGDLGYLSNIESPLNARQFISAVGRIAYTIMTLDKPVIAMVNGVAAGAGFNLALSCDIVYAAKSARFAQSFAKVGLVPDCAGMYLLPRIIGTHKAKELMFTGDLIDSATALSLGLVNHVVDDEHLTEAVYPFAGKLAASPPIALGMMKRVINKSGNLDLKTLLDLEADMQAICMQTGDHKEGVAAFKEKRPPVFQGL